MVVVFLVVFSLNIKDKEWTRPNLFYGSIEFGIVNFWIVKKKKRDVVKKSTLS